MRTRVKGGDSEERERCDREHDSGGRGRGTASPRKRQSCLLLFDERASEDASRRSGGWRGCASEPLRREAASRTMFIIGCEGGGWEGREGGAALCKIW